MEEKKCCGNCKANFIQSYRNVLCERTMKWDSDRYCCDRWEEKKEADKNEY